MVGTCEDTPQRCYCDGAHTIFRPASDTCGGAMTAGDVVDTFEEAEKHPESYCPLKLDNPDGVESRMFSYTGADDSGAAVTRWTIPVLRRERCQNHVIEWECERYPNSNPNWPPDDYTLASDIPGGWANTYRLLDEWIEVYESYDPTESDKGIVGYAGDGETTTGCDRTCAPSSCWATSRWNCTGVWQCNCWRDCDEGTSAAVTNKTDAGYIMPRDPDGTKSYPPDGEVNIGSPAVGDVWVTVQDRVECEECPAQCGLESHQCRQCWCEYIDPAFGFMTAPDSPWVLNGDYAHMTQYKESLIDATGDNCYRPWEGFGSPPPSSMRACVNPETCVDVPCVQRNFQTCGDGCGPMHVDRDVACCRQDGVAVPLENCEPNPLGDNWELIMSVGDDEEDQPFSFDSEYWEDSNMVWNEKCADADNRKLRAFNSMKFNMIKMCFGYGFDMPNPDFELDSSSEPAVVFTQENNGITGWSITGEGAADRKSVV